MRSLRRCGELLESGESAVTAVVAAVEILEDDPAFNAGTGSVLTLSGEVEMDAAVCSSEEGFGAVAAIRAVRHPITVALQVLRETDHVLLAGDGALEFARAKGHPPHNAVTAARLESWQTQMSAAREGSARHFPRAAHITRGGSTVGAVAVDADGVLAAATSTGGITLQMSGRVGDSPLPGAGTWATPHAAVSATGHGEGIVRLLLANRICDLASRGMGLVRAADRALADLIQAEVEAGFIAAGLDGEVQARFNAPAMAWATWTPHVTHHFAEEA
jgi:beta-aspartyl-peptidase (threonine type)